MRKFILSSLGLFSHVAIFLILVMGLTSGAINGGIAGDVGGAVVGGAIGFLVSLVVCVVLFGAVFLLMDIAENTRRAADAIEALRTYQRD